MNAYDHELLIAIKAVREAAHLAEQVSVSLDEHTSLVKTDMSPVTMADYGVQAIIHRQLAENFPEDPIVSEEDADDLSRPENSILMSRLLELLNGTTSKWRQQDVIDHIGRGRYGGGPDGRFWTLDPIDGTKGFIRGDQYAIALALIEHGKPVLGILGCPRLNLPVNSGGDEIQRGWICWASSRHAYAESLTGGLKRKLATSGITNSADAVMCESFESGHSAHDTSSLIAGDLKIHRSPVRMDSQAKYAAVAAGLADVYLRLPTKSDYREKIWDHAAGAFIVQAAGGLAGDVTGVPLDFSQGRTLKNNKGIVATAAGIFADVTRVVKAHV